MIACWSADTGAAAAPGVAVLGPDVVPGEKLDPDPLAISPVRSCPRWIVWTLPPES